MSEKDTNTSVKQDTFENDLLKISVNKNPGCRVSMQIHVSPKASEAAYQKSIKSINKEVSLPGFRKGKAPVKMVEDNYGKYVDQEWKDILIKTAFQDALQLTKIYPLSEDSINKPQLKSATRSEGAEITFEFEATPDIPTVNSNELSLKKAELQPVSEKQIEESLENIQLHHAKWDEIEDRAVEVGDYIDVDIEDEQNPGHFICKDTRFEVADGKMGDWMLKLVVGKKVNDTVEGVSERSSEMDPEAEFIPTQCKIIIKSVKNATLPEIDDELAKKIGADSVEDLKEKVTANLSSQAEQDVQNKLRDQLDTVIAERFPFDVPHSLVQREVQNRLDFMKREMRKAEKSEEEISKKIEEVGDQLTEDVKRSFRLFFISRRIADENKISVSQDELVKELMMQMYDPNSPMDTSLDPEEARSKIYVNLLSQKVKDFLIGQASVE